MYLFLSKYWYDTQNQLRSNCFKFHLTCNTIATLDSFVSISSQTRSVTFLKMFFYLFCCCCCLHIKIIYNICLPRLLELFIRICTRMSLKISHSFTFRLRGHDMCFLIFIFYQINIKRQYLSLDKMHGSRTHLTPPFRSSSQNKCRNRLS